MAHTHPEGNELKDPVCGMTVKADTPHRTTHDGHEVLFCSAGCKTKFQEMEDLLLISSFIFLSSSTSSCNLWAIFEITVFLLAIRHLQKSKI